MTDIHNPINAQLRSEWNQNGFPNRTDTTMGWVNGTRTFTLTPGTTAEFYIAGEVYTLSAATDIIIADTTGTHLIYIDAAGDLQELVNPSHNEVDDAIENKCLVASLYYNTTGS